MTSAPFCIDYVSDMHVDWYRSNAGLGHSVPEARTFFRQKSSDALLVCGDISDDSDDSIEYLRELASIWDDVLWLDGNHDFYCDEGTVEDAMAAMRASLSGMRNVTYLAGGAWISPDGSVAVAGVNGWHDFSFVPHLADPDIARNTYYSTSCSDRRYLEFAASVDDLARIQAEQLAATIDAEYAAGRQVVVATHTPPHWLSLDLSPEKLGRMRLTPGSLGSSHMTQILESRANRIEAWIHGHEHGCYSYRHCGVPVLCNARGYPQHASESCRVQTLKINAGEIDKLSRPA